MAYCSMQDLKNLLPKSMTIGDNTVPTVTNKSASTLSTSVANAYIDYATQFIDSRLSQLYIVPIVKIKKTSVDLQANMLPGSTDVIVTDVAAFNVGSSIVLEDDNGTERATVLTIPENITVGTTVVHNFTHLILSSPTTNAYDAGSHGTVHLCTYPDPIPVMASRYACSLLFDKVFVADQAPDISAYGRRLRNMTIVDMNGILMGQVRLMGQEFNSRRFVRSQLFDAVSLAVDGITYEQGLENG